MRKYLLSLFMAVFTLFALAQTSSAQVIVKGKLLDATTQDPLVGATVLLKGTTTATSAALDGSFKLKLNSAGGTLVISYVGYVSKEVEVTGDNVGVIMLSPNSASVKEVVVTANPSLKINRETPIAASSVNQVYIDEKGAGAEYPELMEMTPGTTVSRVGGGYGDSRITIRGFSSNNTALLINGIPVNDPEAGTIYWNDWAGLQDITTSMQIQRGLGASTIAVPSIGGTINITTRSTEANPGGVVSQSVGSYGAEKTLVSYATGLSDNGWASSFLLSRTTGTSPSGQGLYYTGYNYFANISKVLSKNQSLSIDFMGAAQRHGQRYTRTNTISTYRNAPQGTRYNSDWGYLNGQVYSAEQNYYNKPLASIKYNWSIDQNTTWSTVAYGTWGSGASDFLGAKSGTNVTLAPGSSTEVPRIGGTYSPIDFNAIVKSNSSTADGSANYLMEDANNVHQQYGLISSLTKKVGNITYLAGIDMRYYTGEHFYTATNLFGANYWQDTYSASAVSGNINNPDAQVTTGGKFLDDYRYFIQQEGVYAQAEYKKDALSAFLTLAGTNTGNRREDYFNYLSNDPNRETKWLNFLGYQAKGGANYNLDANNNIYANVGYIQRAPLVAALFLDKENHINPNGRPEKLLDYELGYGYISALFSLNANAYMATYKDISKVYEVGTANQDGTVNTANVNGLGERHEGIELEAKLHPAQWVTIGGMFSINNYEYTSNTASGQITDPTGKTTNVPTLYLKGLPIGAVGSSTPTSAQTTAGGDVEFKVLPQVKLGATYLYYARYYATYDLTSITSAGYTPYKLPNVGTANLDVVYRFKMAGFNAEFVGNVYNLFNTQYIGDAYDTSAVGTNYVTRTKNLGVFYGAGRYYMTTLRFKF